MSKRNIFSFLCKSQAARRCSSVRKKLRSSETKTQLLKSHIVVKSFLEFHLSHSLFVARARHIERERAREREHCVEKQM